MKKRTVIYVYLITLFSAVVFADTLPNPFTPFVFVKQVQPMPVDPVDLIDSTLETETGDMILFPSYFPHKVEAVTSGVRWVIVGWYSGDKHFI